MSSGSVAAVVFGLVLLIAPVWVLGLCVRRLHRLSTWPRAQGSVEHVWTTTRQSHATGQPTTEKSSNARYAFVDATGRHQTGVCEYLKDPKAGDPIEVMYRPDNPKDSQPVYGGSVVGRTLTLGFIVIFFGGLGVFLVLAGLDLLSM